LKWRYAVSFLPGHGKGRGARFLRGGPGVLPKKRLSNRPGRDLCCP
jgi:hypothetical protein